MILMFVSLVGFVISGWFWVNAIAKDTSDSKNQSSELGISVKQLDARTFDIERQFSAFSTPNLHCSLVSGGIPGGIYGGPCRILYQLRVVNSGSPSIAWRWHLRVKLNTGQAIETDANEVPSWETLINTNNQQQMVLSNDTYLANSLLENPIQTGAGKIGWITFSINTATLDDLSRIGNEFILSFQDCRGKITSLTNIINQSGGQF